MNLFVHQIFSALVLASVYALLAVSMTFIYSVSHQIQLAHGDVMVLGAYTGYLIDTLTGNLILSFMAGFLVGGVIGIVLNDAIFRWLRRGYMYLVAGLALAAIAEQAIVLTVDQGRPITYPASSGGSTSVALQWTVIAVCLGIGVVFQLFVSRSQLGRSLRATADNHESATLLGVRVERMIRLGFGLGSAMAGVSGVLLALLYRYMTPTTGANIDLLVVAIVLFGGLGSVPGAVLAALVVALTEVFSGTYISSGYADVFAFALIIVVVRFRPAGLLGNSRAVRA